MHRVYNSAFMNMLKLEENEKYRATVRNVLEFSPEVIKRFVNFMNNPDERTAVEQFGKGDKYYGVAMLMATMPGLPMFGHGQLEGFSEKYGMEYRRAYWDEQVDEHMISRHETEIFPLMRKRHLFSGAEHFAFYDARTPGDAVDENVFAYSNRCGTERALILYNNAYTTTQCVIYASTPINTGDADNKTLVTRTLAEALDLDTGETCYYAFRDYRTKLEFLRHAPRWTRDGFAFELQAYQYRAFLDFREIQDTGGTWARLAASIGDTGVPSLDEAYREMILEPIHAPFRNVMNAEILCALADHDDAKVRKQLKDAMMEFLAAVTEKTAVAFDAMAIWQNIESELDFLGTFEIRLKKLRCPKRITEYLLSPVESSIEFWRTPLAYTLTHPLGTRQAASDYSIHATARMDEWMLAKIVAEAFGQLSGADENAAAHLDALLVKILLAYPTLLDFRPRGGGGVFPIRRLFDDITVQRYLLMNRHDGVVWFNKEQIEKLMYWMLLESVIVLGVGSRLTKSAVVSRYENAMEILDAAQESGYKTETLIHILTEEK